MSVSDKDPIPSGRSASSTPLLPRRTFLAVFLSALTAALGAGLIWAGLLGAPQTESFQFSRGTGFASGEAARLRGFLADAMQDDRLAVVIVGHTGSDGDPAANLELSEARAEAAQAVALEMGIAPDRVSAAGVGGANPTGRESGQSDRAYQTSLARVEVTLQVRE